VVVGSYPGEKCVVRVHGSRHAVEAAADIVRDHLRTLDADPTSASVRRALAVAVAALRAGPGKRGLQRPGRFTIA
jgi:hypothetical protein